MYIEWISVDDRLPKNGETVIVCYLENAVQHVFHGYRIEHHQENGEMDCCGKMIMDQFIMSLIGRHSQDHQNKESNV